MSPTRIRLLLLQARRADDLMREHELECFVDRSGMHADRVSSHDLCEGPPTGSELKRFDAVMVGGSGDFYVSRGNLPHFDKFLDFLREAVDLGMPTFGSCFGYQCLVHALGGEIIHDPENTEVGTFDLELTDQGADDELFNLLPRKFRAQMGHKDRAARHPDGVPNLASSKLSPFQALRIPGKPIWATQFHPELTHNSNRERFQAYLDGYAESLNEQERAQALENFMESPEASNLLNHFLHLVFS